MSEIFQLVKRLCPNGVRHVQLNEVAEIYDGTHVTPKYTNEGVKFVSVENIKDINNTKKFISPEDFHKLYKIKPQKDDVFMTRIGTIGACAVIENDEELAFYVTLALIRPNPRYISSRYLKIILESQQGKKQIRKRTLIHAVPIKINLGDIGKVIIPLPPLEIQQEIVNFLENFSNLTTQLVTELTAELTARKKQYEYYRALLLSDKTRKHVTLGDVCKITRGRVMSKEYLRDNAGQYPVYSSQTANSGIFGFIDSYDFDAESITWTTDGANAGSVFYHVNEKFSITNVCGLLRVINNNELSTRYLYYQLQIIAKGYVSSGMGNPKLMSNVMSRIQVPLPSYDEQERIVAILDRFDALCNDLTSGLPAEIEARRKQYEYYRDTLLTFKEAKK